MQSTIVTLTKRDTKNHPGRYKVTHDGYHLKVYPLDWRPEIKATMPNGSPNINLRYLVFNKLGIKQNAGGEIFVPIAYTKRTGRKTFRGMTFNQIRKEQRNDSWK